MLSDQERCQRELQKDPIPWQRITNDTVNEGHTKRAPGLFYGLEFPWTAALLLEFGPQWLTKAMHKAGSLSEGNEVTHIDIEDKIKITTGNNGGKFFFEVKYAKEEPGLHKRLFAKIPFPLEGATRSDRLSSSVNKQPAEFTEINTYRLLQGMLPMKTPRFYFGDISCESTNWIIITERIEFADHGGISFDRPGEQRPPPLKPFEIEGPYDKCLDHNLRGDPKEYYLLLVRTGAAMAGQHRAGLFGSMEAIEVHFPALPWHMPVEAWGMNPTGVTGEMPKMLKQKLGSASTFISQVGKVLFPDYVVTEPFLARFNSTMLTMNAYTAELAYWRNQQQYRALSHPNMNVDNAYFWHDEAGKLDLGVFDWGGVHHAGMGVKLWWWLYCSDYEDFEQNLSDYVDVFVTTFKEYGGPELDRDELRMMIMISGLEQLNMIVAAVPQIYRMCPQKEWPTIKDRYDPRIGLNVDDKSTLRLYLHVMNKVLRMIGEMQADELLQRWIKEIYGERYGESPKRQAVIEGEAMEPPKEPKVVTMEKERLAREQMLREVAEEAARQEEEAKQKREAEERALALEKAQQEREAERELEKVAALARKREEYEEKYRLTAASDEELADFYYCAPQAPLNLVHPALLMRPSTPLGVESDEVREVVVHLDDGSEAVVTVDPEVGPLVAEADGSLRPCRPDTMGRYCGVLSGRMGSGPDMLQWRTMGRTDREVWLHVVAKLNRHAVQEPTFRALADKFVAPAIKQKPAKPDPSSESLNERIARLPYK